MIAYVDTNVLVRHLTDDPPDQASRATAILENAERLILTDLVVAELVYVLESYYERPRSQIVESVQSLLTLSSIAVTSHDLLLRALELYEHSRLDFAKAYLASAAELTGIGTVASFDRTLDRVETIDRVHDT
ncbi:MAG: type II toxin-antitoxin system VapC family toxin [Actinomycetota bacterium]|nr:type II toxin-antitoxin system VapC family toxin [Actinomycetota bacterium]